MTPELEAIKARLEAATPGPWKPQQMYVSIGGGTGEIAATGPITKTTPAVDFREPTLALQLDADAELIAHAPTDLRKLIRAVEIAEKALARIEATVADGRPQTAAREARAAMAEALKGGE